MQINNGSTTIVWNGSHTANIYEDGREVDCFTFAFHTSKPTAIDFVDAAISHLAYVDA